MLNKAVLIAAQGHLNQMDKGGNPYILHPLYVMHKVRHFGEDFMITAVLHDIVEDTDWTIEGLKSEGFNSDVLTALDLLTHKDGQSYWDYIDAISRNQIATRVKMADLTHNSKISRLKGVREKDIKRMEKYHKAYLMLKNCI